MSDSELVHVFPADDTHAAEPIIQAPPAPPRKRRRRAVQHLAGGVDGLVEVVGTDEMATPRAVSEARAAAQVEDLDERGQIGVWLFGFVMIRYSLEIILAQKRLFNNDL